MPPTSSFHLRQPSQPSWSTRHYTQIRRRLDHLFVHCTSVHNGQLGYVCIWTVTRHSPGEWSHLRCPEFICLCDHQVFPLLCLLFLHEWRHSSFDFVSGGCFHLICVSFFDTQWSNSQQSDSQTMHSSQIRAAKLCVTAEVIEDISPDIFTSPKSTIDVILNPDLT